MDYRPYSQRSDSRSSAPRDSYRLPSEPKRISVAQQRPRRRASVSTDSSEGEYRGRHRQEDVRSYSRPGRSPRWESSSISTSAQSRAASREASNFNWRVPAVFAGIAVVIMAVVFMLVREPEPAPQGLIQEEVVEEQAPAIEPSPAVEMFIPDIDLHATFSEGSCRVQNGAIDPKSMNEACTYTAENRPYSLPGTNAPDLTVIAGHTGAGVPGVFNNLYDGTADQHTVAEDAKLYIRTEASGDTWLTYTATDFHDPSKDMLDQDSAVWGDGPMPGRLLTISCIQPPNPLEAAVRNSVVGWQYEGTATTSPVEQAPPEVEA